MLTPQEFKARWERTEDRRLVTFPPIALWDLKVSPEVRDFLVEIGLPDGAAPFLGFGPPKSGALERVSHVWQQPAIFDRYRIIGGNGSGDPLCLDEEAEGRVVYVNHDNDFDVVLISSSVFTLAECLLEVRDFIEVAGDFESLSTDQYRSLMEIIESIDPAVGGKDGFWAEELDPEMINR